MNVLDSRVKSSTPVVSVNFRKVQDLYNAIDDLRATMILEKKDLYLVATYMNKFSLVEGVIITFIALEAISYDPLKLVVDTLNSIAIHHSGDYRYKVPYELALDILADLPIPYEVILEDMTSAVLNVQEQARLEKVRETGIGSCKNCGEKIYTWLTPADDPEYALYFCCSFCKEQFDSPDDTQELPQEITWGNCNCCNAPLNDNHIEWNDEFYCDMVCAEETDGE